MTVNAQGAWVAILPKTVPATTANSISIVYFFESISSSYTATRSGQSRVPVRPPSQCDNAGAVIFTGSNPNITLGATSGPPLAPGFQASGISSFISPTGMTSAATGGGGVSGRTLAIIGGGAGAAAFFAFSGGDGETTSTSDAIGGITTTAGTTTTTAGGGGPSSTTTTTTGGGGTSSITGGGTTTSDGGGSTTTGGTTSTPTTSVPTTSVPTTVPTTTIATTSTSGTTLSVSKSDSVDPVVVGNNMTYTIRVTNTGSARADNVFIEDFVPASMSILATSGGCVVGGVQVLCNLGNINAGSNKEIVIIVRATSAGTFNNSATATSTTAPNATGSETTTVTSSLRTLDSQKVTVPLRSFLDIKPHDGRTQGRIVINDSLAREITNSGVRVLRLEMTRGENLLEARFSPSDPRSGFWRIDFSASAEFVSGSIRVLSGQAISVDANSAIFRVGHDSPPVRFTYELKSLTGSRKQLALPPRDSL